MLDLTVYRGARSATPTARDALAWGEFVAEVEALCREESAATDKRDLPALGPYRLRAGATRAAANVERMSAVAALDLDGVDLDALRARLQSLGVAAIVHGSPSDDPAGTRKARAYVALDREHDPADAGRVRASVAALLGVQVDPACANADRVFFCGRLAGTAPRYVERFEGRPLTLAELPAAPLPATNRATIAPAPERDDPAYDAATLAILGAVGPWHEHAGRKHALCGALGGMLRHAPGWSRERCATLIRAWLPAAEPGVDVEAGVTWACAAWDKLPEEVSGRAALDALVGARAGAVVEAAALLPWRARQEAPAEVEAGAAGDASPYATLEAVDLDTPPAPLDYVVPGLELAPGKCSALQGFAYTAKTPFALLLATCVAAGVPFLGMPVAQRPVAYVDHEPSLLTQERAVRIRLGLGLAPGVPLAYFRAEQLSAAMLDELGRVLAGGVGMLVHDTYSSAVPVDGGSFNDSSFRVWADALGRLGARHGALVLTLLHENKNDGGGLRGISGHGSLAGALQASIRLTRPDENDTSRIKVECTRATRKGFAPFELIWRDVPCEGAPEGVALVAERVGAPAAVAPAPAPRAAPTVAPALVRVAGERIMRSIPVGVWSARKELVALAGGNVAAGREALARLVAAGMLEVRAGSYAPTIAGQTAGGVALAMALGDVGGFAR